MAGSPNWKVYRGQDYMAACKEVEAAAALAAFYGDGATIRWGHAKQDTVWSEGQEAQEASESYDYVATTAYERLDAIGARYRGR